MPLQLKIHQGNKTRQWSSSEERRKSSWKIRTFKVLHRKRFSIVYLGSIVGCTCTLSKKEHHGSVLHCSREACTKWSVIEHHSLSLFCHGITYKLSCLYCATISTFLLPFQLWYYVDVNVNFIDLNRLNEKVTIWVIHVNCEVDFR